MFGNHHVCVVLRFSVRHIGSWNCPKLMHKFKYIYILIYGIKMMIGVHKGNTNLQMIPCFHLKTVNK